MKLRLPHRFHAALLAAIASVSFTTLSTGTLGTAVFALAGHQAAGEETETATAASGQQDLSGDYEAAKEAADQELAQAAGPTDEERKAEDKLNEELEDNARMAKEKEDEQKRETTTDPLDEEALERTLDSVNSSGGGSGSLLSMLGSAPAETETAAPVAAPAQQASTAATGPLPSNDLGFTTNPYATVSSAASEPVFQMPVAAPQVQTLETPAQGTAPAATASLASAIPTLGTGSNEWDTFPSFQRGYLAFPILTAHDNLLEPPAQDGVLYWHGGPGVWDHEAPNWHPSSDTSASVAFTDGSNLAFTVTGESVITMTEQRIAAGDVTVGQGVDLSLSSGGSMLTAGHVDVQGNLTVTNVLVTAASLNVEGGSRVTANVVGEREGALATNVSGAGDMIKTGTGSLRLTGDNAAFSGRLTIEQGAVIAGGTSGKALGDNPNVVLNGGELKGAITPGGNANIAAKANAAVSADIAVAAGNALTFNTEANVTLTSSGNISGAGDIYKAGTGTLVLDAANTFTGNLNINAGTVLVSNTGALGSGDTRNVTVGTGSSLVFAAGNNAYSANNISLDRGSSLTFSGASTTGESPLLSIGKLSLTANSSVDFSNIQIDRYGTYVLASVTTLAPAEPGIWKPDQTGGLDLVQFVSMTGVTTKEGFTLSSDDLVSLHYNQGTKLLTLEVAQASQGYYWIPDCEKSVWDTETANWKLNNEGNPTTFVNQQTQSGKLANSAYFLDAGTDGKEEVDLSIANVYLHDLVVANGEYTFTYETPQGTLDLDRNRLSNFVVRSGAKAHFVNADVFGGENSVVHICKDAEASISGVVNWNAYSVNNEGSYTVEFSTEMAMAMGLLSHVDNTGYMSVSLKASNAYGGITVGEVMNREGATMVLALPTLYPDFSYGNGAFHNMGELIYGIPDEGVTGTMESPLPIDGTGIFKTQGAAYIIRQNAKVEQSSMELGASLTQLNGLVTISDKTTVKSGATAELIAGGTLGDVTLEESATMQLRGDGMSYTGRAAVGGAESSLKVEKDASLTLDSYNAGTAPAGYIAVGGGAPSSTSILTIKGETNVASLDVCTGEARLLGKANVMLLTQSHGTVQFFSDSYLGGGSVVGGTLKIENGQVLTVGSVINVTHNNYTVAATTGSIDASALNLEKNMENAGYVEAVSTTKTTWQSGFLDGGQQYVQVFDLQGGATLTSNGATVTHKDAAGSMTLDDTGRGYLDTSETVYATYYVRDNYVTGDPGTRGGEARTADYVKLSNVIEASKGSGETPQLETVVFDKTEYNANEEVSGTLTVDVQGQHADLFDAKAGAVGIVNIDKDAQSKDVVVLAGQDYAGVAGSLKLAGSGVYQIDNRSDLGGNASLLAETTAGIGPWTGTVRITGAAAGLGMAPLSVGSGESASTIEFSQWTGTFAYTEGQTMESDAKILLTGNGVDADPAITLAAGNADLKWTNTVTGANARIVHREAGDFKLVVTGDTSSWNGTVYQGAADSTVDLQFLQNTGSIGTQSANMLASNGTMNVTYGGDVKNVNGMATVYSDGVMNLTYTGTDMTVNGTITQFQGQGKLALTVGDGNNAASATFSGALVDTYNATMTVKEDSTATIDTDAALLRVVGGEGATVNVADGKTLELASTAAAASYSQFYNLDNRGTIKMQGSGGAIKLIDTTGKTYDLGALQIAGAPGTAAIETSGVAGQTTVVKLNQLSSTGESQVLKLMNDNGQGTVDYNLGGDTAYAGGAIQFGSNGASGDVNVVLNSGNVAANAVLQSTGSGSGTANIAVNADAAQMLGIDSTEGSTAGGKIYGVDSQRVATITGNGTYSYNGALGQNLDIAYTGSGKQTFEGGAAGFSGKVTVDNGTTAGGVLELLNASSVSITDLTIGAGDTLDLRDGSNVGTAEVSGTMKAGGGSTASGTGSASKLDGSLTLGNTATYDVSAAGGTGGLNLTGALTITQGALLSAGDMNVVWAMQVEDKYDLAFGVTDMSSFGPDVNWDQGVDASTVFDNGMKEGEFYIRYSGATGVGGKGENVGAVYLFRVAVPEPATSTLSLLALAALAARRRRK